MIRDLLNAIAVPSLAMFVMVALCCGTTFESARGFRPGGGSLGPYHHSVRPLYNAIVGGILILLGLPPCAWLVMRVIDSIRPTRRPGLCAKCGYDLCATPARCPECGTEHTRG
jgi:hypothetical protein